MTYYADNNNGPKQYKTEIFYFIDTKTKKGKAETKQLQAALVFHESTDDKKLYIANKIDLVLNTSV